jgi:peptidoglycan-associated lipoprotein
VSLEEMRDECGGIAMREKWLMLLIMLCLFLGLGGCASVIKPIPAQDLNPKIRSGALIQKTHHFEMILDTSASMKHPYTWSHFEYTSPMMTTMLEFEQHLARLFNDTIPGLKLNAGLRDFAGKRWLSRPYETRLWYGMAPYVKAELGKSIFDISTYGVESPLDAALDAATADLKPLSGKSAVIIFSDGIGMPKAPGSAQAMKNALKDNVCIYAVLIGKDPEGKALLGQVVKAGQCGLLVTGEEVSTAAGMASFVEKVFLTSPATAAGVPGAPGALGIVPGTLSPGIPEKLEAIFFDFDKYSINSEFRDALKRNAEWLEANRGFNIRIEGNCDERGANEYNLALGQRRADAAAMYLGTLGVDAKRIKTISYGEERPVCKEHNEACWWKNRNAMFTVTMP